MFKTAYKNVFFIFALEKGDIVMCDVTCFLGHHTIAAYICLSKMNFERKANNNILLDILWYCDCR